MAVLAPRVLAAPLLEDNQVRTARLLDDRGHDLGAGHGRRADLFADHPHVVELDLVAGLALEPPDREPRAGGDRQLLSTRADNGDHDDTPLEAYRPAPTHHHQGNWQDLTLNAGRHEIARRA